MTILEKPAQDAEHPGVGPPAVGQAVGHVQDPHDVQNTARSDGGGDSGHARGVGPIEWSTVMRALGLALMLLAIPAAGWLFTKWVKKRRADEPKAEPEHE